MTVVELHATGRTSGLPRSTILTAPVVDGDRFVLVASKGAMTAIPSGSSTSSPTPTSSCPSRDSAGRCGLAWQLMTRETSSGPRWFAPTRVTGATGSARHAWSRWSSANLAQRTGDGWRVTGSSIGLSALWTRSAPVLPSARS